MLVDFVDLVCFWVVKQGYGAVLGHHGIDGPCRCEWHAPTYGSAGDGDHHEARIFQIVQGLKGIWCDGALGGEGVANVREDAHDIGACTDGPRGEWFHEGQ